MAARHPRLTQFIDEHLPHHDLTLRQDAMNNVGKAERKVLDIARLVTSNTTDENGCEAALRDLGIALNTISRSLS